MPFVADKRPSNFVPDKPRATGGFVPDNAFVADAESQVSGLFGTKIGTAEKPFYGSGLLGRAVGVSPEEASVALLSAAREPGRLARKGLGYIPDIPEGQHQSTTLNFLQNMERGKERIAKEFIASFVDPESALIAGAGVLAKPFIKPGAKFLAKAGEKISEKAPGLARLFTYRFGQPEAYKELAETRLGNIGRGAERAGEVGKLLSKGLSKTEQQTLGTVIKGEGSALPGSKIAEVAKTARDELTKLGSEAVSEGLLDEQTYLKNVQKYMPRLYRKYEQGQTSMADVFGAKPQRILGKRFLKRQDISEEVRAFLGEIKEPAYPVARGIAQLTHDVETAKLFRTVAENPEWASREAVEGFTKLDTTKRLGALAGKYVHPEIARDINEIIRVPGTAEKVYKDIIHAWKFGKVVTNPATHARNMMSNSILMDVVGGVDLQKQPALLAKSAKEMAKNGKFFQEAKAANLLGHEFSTAEINGFIDAFDKPAETVFGKIMNIPKKTARIAGRTYQAEEKVFKLAQFIHAREGGLGVKEAAKQAEDVLFNYDKVSPFIKKARSSLIGAPFITFTAKAVPAIAKAGVQNPMRIYKYKILFDSMENMAREKFDLTDQEVNTIKRNQRGTVVILPFKDKNGQLQTLDLSYILPWGDIGEQGGMFGLPPSLSPGGILKPVVEVGANKSFFKAAYSKFDPKKAQIYLDSDPPSTVWRKRIDYLYKSFFPSFAPPIPGVSAGGYHTDKLIKSQMGKADYFGRTRSVATVLADVMLGLKASPVDPDVMNRFERVGIQKELQEIRAEVKNKYRNKGLSQEEKEEARAVMAEKIQRLLLKKSQLEK